jgi:EAL domain-containing protein (putative c-di-GMP-specific phosphodiesterase class I)
VAVDQFGSGLSSLPYLSRLPPRSVKTDSVFVDGTLHDSGTRTVLGTMNLFSPAPPEANITRMLQVQSAPRRFLR